MPFTPVARVVGAHGLKGYLKLDLLTDFPERLSAGSRLRLDGQWVTVWATSVHQNRLMVLLAEVKDRTSAEALRGKVLEAEDRKPNLDPDEFMVRDLVGCRVVTTGGVAIGAVDDVLPYPAHDVLVVGETLIPFVKAIVKSVNLAAREVVVDPIPGLLDQSGAVE